MTPERIPGGADARPPLYFVNAPVDFLCVGGGSVILFGLFTLFQSGVRSDGLIALAGWLVWVCNWPHFAATGYRLYGSKSVMRDHPFAAFVFPIFVLAATAGWMISPDGFAPYYIKFFLIWAGFHYAGQNVAFTMIYAKRAGLEIRPIDGSVLRLASYAMVFSPAVAAEVDVTGENFYYGQAYPNLGVPAWIAEAAGQAVVVLSVALIVMALIWCVRLRRPVPLIVLCPIASHVVWFVLCNNSEGYREFVPFFHCLQYQLVAWGAQLQLKMEEKSIVPSRRYVVIESLRWYGVTVAVGAALFWFIPEGLAKLGVDWNVSNGAMSGAVMTMHFFLDGILWRVNVPHVAGPLIRANLGILTGRRAPAPIS